MNGSSSCQQLPVVTRSGEFTPVRFGEERRATDTGARCHDCDVTAGGFHHRGCDAEECPACHRQLISIWPTPANVKGRYTQDHVCNPIKVITLPSVFDGSSIPLLVGHSDGTWQVLDGAGTEGREPVVAVVTDISDLHDSLREVLNLPNGWEAWRHDPHAEWQRAPLPD